METRRQWESLCKSRPSSIRAVKTGVSVEWPSPRRLRSPAPFTTRRCTHQPVVYQCLTECVLSQFTTSAAGLWSQSSCEGLGLGQVERESGGMLGLSVAR